MAHTAVCHNNGVIQRKQWSSLATGEDEIRTKMVVQISLKYQYVKTLDVKQLQEGIKKKTWSQRGELDEDNDLLVQKIKGCI